MEFLLINHPLDCPVCDKGGECPLQNQAMSNGRGESRFTETKRTFLKPINISAQILLDRERCVLCARCTRFSEQIAGDPFIALIERGALQQVGIYEKEPFESYFSGNTVQICPVGALTSAAYRFRSRPFDLISTPSVCEHCASGCALRTDHRRGKVTRRLAGNDPSVNEEWNCDKGRFAFRSTTLEDRLTRPMVRDEETGEMRPASWPEAFAVAARGLGGRAELRSACSPVAGSPRGRLRLRQVRPRGARHQRRRLPGPPALRRGGDFLAAHVATQTGVDLRRPRARERRRARRASSPRKRRRSSSCGCARASATTAPASTRSPRTPRAAWRSCTARCSRRTPAPRPPPSPLSPINAEVALDAGGVIIVGERMAASPGALQRRRRARRHDRRQAGLDPASRR